MREIFSFAVALVFVFGLRHLVFRLGNSAVVLEDLFAGETLVRATRGSLKLGNNAAFGVLGLTDLRIVWAPIDRARGFGRAAASAMNPDAIAITLGEVRRARTSWNPWQGSLQLDTPEGTFVLISQFGYFGPWLKYISENARNLLRTGEPVTPMPPRVGFTAHARARAGYSSIAGSFVLGALVLADVLHGGLFLGSASLSVVLAIAALGSFAAGIYFASRRRDVP